MFGPSSVPGPLSIRAQRFDDMDLMARTMIGGHADFVPLSAGRFEGNFCEVDFGSFGLKRILHGPLLMQGAVRSDHVSVSMLARSGSDATLNGALVGLGDIMLLPAGTPTQARLGTATERLTLIFRAAAFSELMDTHGLSEPRRRSSPLLHVGREAAARLARMLSAITEFAATQRELAAQPRITAAVEEECRALLANVLLQDNTSGAVCPAGCAAIRRVRIADEYLQANIERPVVVSELCAAIGIAERTLRQSFLAVYGMGPGQYLKRRRLLLARRALTKPTGTRRMLVKTVALSHGFWHLGHFALDYTKMFGEAPSETLRRLGFAHE